jgi:hypothetical protein
LNFGRTGVLLVIIMTVMFSMLFFYNPIIGLVIAPLPLAIGSAFNLINLPPSIGISVFALGLVFAGLLSLGGKGGKS